jgi:hypothetical protein
LGNPLSISKSKHLNGLQCSKLLWYEYNAKEEIPPVDDATQAIFDQGREVGELAKSLFPGGVEVARGIVDFEEVLPRSLEAIKLRKPLFEAAFRYKSAFARADVLNPVGKEQWDVIEVKSSTEVKRVHLQDLALQRYTYEGAGLKVRRCFLMYINNEYVRHGDIDPEKLFSQEDVTRQIAALLPDVERGLRKMAEVIRLRDHPDIAIGPHCSDPYSCPLQDLCWKFLPPKNVLTLTRIGRKGFDLLNQGILRAKDVPGSVKLTRNQQIQVDAIRTGKPHVEPAKIREFLSQLEYPLHFLDFETFQTAIPIFDQTRPYQQIPFQFSLHILEAVGTEPVHYGFLAAGDTDPRLQVLELLAQLIGKRGSIVAYNATFESTVLKQSCEDFPGFKKWFKSIEERIIDLLVPFRSFHYYHPEQQGSASLKAILPLLTRRSYHGMPIADGGQASREYMRVTFKEVSRREREKVRIQLEEYCGLDTLGMIEILSAMKRLVR